MDGIDFCDTEWKTRVDLAALYRLAVHFGWTDITSTHMSARLPDDPDHYLLNTYDMMFHEITATNLARVSYNGELQGADRTLNQAGHIIHSSVLNARPDVNYVIHSHTRAGIAVSAMPEGLMPLSQHAGFVIGTLATHAYQDSTVVDDEGDALAHDLGDNFAMLLQNHGLLVVGRTAAEAFTYHYFLEMACKVQVDILSCTSNPITITDDAMQALHDWGSPAAGPHGQNHWDALMRMLDDRQPDYRN